MAKGKPITLVIFGGTGDLARNKILSAVLDLKEKKIIQENFRIVGFSRKNFSHDDYREFVRDAIEQKKHQYSDFLIDGFLNNVFYVQGDLNEIESYKNLEKYLKKLDSKKGQCSNKLFYLATPPNLYKQVFLNLDKADLIRPCDEDKKNSWTRLLVEKPFGNDLNEAKNLDKLLVKLFDEDQVFRIDHYLAKDAIQNIISFRFANAIFEPIWDKDLIEKIEISSFEKNGVTERASFYDSIGALRDVGQNHLLQMLALIAMEDPKGLSPDNIQQAKQKVLSKTIPFSRKINEYAFRAQYKGYLQEVGANQHSKTETFFQLKLKIDNKRWKGVPFFISSGKALSENKVEIKVTFKEKDSCVCLAEDICHYGNTITISIQPEKKISIRFWKKTSGLKFDLEEKDLAFSYEGNYNLSNSYSKVFYDCLLGDQTLFPSTREIMAQWELISKVSDYWQDLPLEIYEQGTAPDLLKRLK